MLYSTKNCARRAFSLCLCSSLGAHHVKFNLGIFWLISGLLQGGQFACGVHQKLIWQQVCVYLVIISSAAWEKWELTRGGGLFDARRAPSQRAGPKVTKGCVNESGARVRFIYLFTDPTRAFFTRLHAHAERQTSSHHLAPKDYKSSDHFTPKFCFCSWHEFWIKRR